MTETEDSQPSESLVPPTPPTAFEVGDPYKQPTRPVAAAIVGAALVSFACFGLLFALGQFYFLGRIGDVDLMQIITVNRDFFVAILQMVFGISLLQWKPLARKGAVYLLIGDMVTRIIVSFTNEIRSDYAYYTIVQRAQPSTTPDALPYDILMGMASLDILLPLVTSLVMLFILTRPGIVAAYDLR
ncbi:MAG: hypothetical protein BWY76_01779 [bacterium ADurb.Bin429]|nr:MAG: hypothetical protein BWY76_01779 [bacterium ADurb.Bin429]